MQSNFTIAFENSHFLVMRSAWHSFSPNLQSTLTSNWLTYSSAPMLFALCAPLFAASLPEAESPLLSSDHRSTAQSRTAGSVRLPSSPVTPLAAEVQGLLRPILRPLVLPTLLAPFPASEAESPAQRERDDIARLLPPQFGQVSRNPCGHGSQFRVTISKNFPDAEDSSRSDFLSLHLLISFVGGSLFFMRQSLSRFLFCNKLS